MILRLCPSKKIASLFLRQHFLFVHSPGLNRNPVVTARFANGTLSAEKKSVYNRILCGTECFARKISFCHILYTGGIDPDYCSEPVCDTELIALELDTYRRKGVPVDS